MSFKPQYVKVLCPNGHKYIITSTPREPEAQFGGWWMDSMQRCPEDNLRWMVWSGIGEAASPFPFVFPL
jgi:hypothetical protein